MAWSWADPTLSQQASLLWEGRLAEAIRLAVLVDLAVGVRARPNIVLVAALVRRVVQIYIHRVLLRLIEVLARHIMTLVGSEGSIF